MTGVLTKLKDLIHGYDWEDVKQLFINNVRTALVFGVSVTACWLMFKKPRGIPPGPRLTLPFLGDFLLLGDDDLRIPLRKMRKKYGDIFSFYMGQKLVVCLNGYEIIREALVKNGDVFSDKPHLFLYDMLFQHRGISLSNGQLWKEQRKFALGTLREFGFGRTMMEDKIMEEIQEYISVISKHQGEPYDMYRLTQEAVSNIIVSLVFGQRFYYNNEKFQEFIKAVEEFFEATGNGAIVNFIPSLNLLPGDIFKVKKFVECFRFIENEIVNPAIREHEENYDENDTRDFISSYLKEMKRVENTGQKSHIDAENLPMAVIDLFVAGSETTSTTIMWAILYLLHHPDIQARCYKEVQDVIGYGRLPSLKDRDSMQYTQAFILEILRISNIVITGDPHSVSRDILFNGYWIPKGTIVLSNLDSVLSDEKVWGDPEVFRPERFLDTNGRIIQREEFIPFSMGRRVCLGESMARLELFLFITTLVQRFEFRPVDPDNLPTLKGVFGITHTPAKYKVLLESRLS